MPVPGRGLAGRPTVDLRDHPGVFVAGNWVGPAGLLADAALARGCAAGVAASAVAHAARADLARPSGSRRDGDGRTPALTYDSAAMARPAKFSTEQILETAAQLVAERGPSRTTVTSIAERIGAPTGSIYHRFVSRDLLLAQLWVRTARHAQAGFIAALADDDLDRAVSKAAGHIPRWARENFDDAIVMLLYRREDLAQRWPEEMGDVVAELGDSVLQAVRSFTRRWYGKASRSNVEAVTFALLDIPYAATRRHLARGEAPPVSIEPLVERAARAVISRD